MAKHKKKLSKGESVGLALLALLGLGFSITMLLQGTDVALLNPKGLIADQQHRLLTVSIGIMLAFAVPVLFMLYFFAWKYRETNHKATYDSSIRHGKLTLLIMWVIPVIVLIALASLMVPATFKLEPQKSIESDKEPLKVRVVALRWKWLFIYPKQNIATVNFVQIPVDTPVQFELTADETPMSSFWIPHLGGQLYAMTEHVNRLNLMGNTLGDFPGSAAEINGAGFAGMRFTTRVSTDQEFNAWVQSMRQSTNELSPTEYEKLLAPSENHQVMFYGKADPKIYNDIVSKYGSSHKHYIEPYKQEGH